MPLTFTKCYGEETMSRTLFVHGVMTEDAADKVAPSTLPL
jgi:hypothetical protein